MQRQLLHPSQLGRLVLRDDGGDSAELEELDLGSSNSPGSLFQLSAGHCQSDAGETVIAGVGLLLLSRANKPQPGLAWPSSLSSSQLCLNSISASVSADY